MAKDLVCGMQVEEKEDSIKKEYKGEAYYFCSEGCKKDFEKHPEKYINQEC